MKNGMRQVPGTNETFAMKKVHIAECFYHAMDKMIHKLARCMCAANATHNTHTHQFGP